MRLAPSYPQMVSVPISWPQWAGVAGLILLVVCVLAGGTALWQLSSDGPNYRTLDAAAWRQVQPAVSGMQANPRRHMAYAAQDWLEGQAPARFQVFNLLGPADAFPEAGAEAYRVGCGFTAPGCAAEEWLVVRYGPDGRVASTAFQRASYLPSERARLQQP